MLVDSFRKKRLFSSFCTLLILLFGALSFPDLFPIDGNAQVDTG
jgi:hypothetical protein